MFVSWYQPTEVVLDKWTLNQLLIFCCSMYAEACHLLFFLFVCIFVGHAVNEINEVLQQICHAQVVIMGQNVTLRDRALWYITSKIRELWHQNSQVGKKIVTCFLYIIWLSAMEAGWRTLVCCRS